MTGLAGWFLLNVVVAIFGAWLSSEKSRNAMSWFLLCLIFGLIALVALAGAPALDPARLRTGGWDSLGSGHDPTRGPPMG